MNAVVSTADLDPTLERRTNIYPSEAATILGLNPYQTPLQLWMEKTGRRERPDLSDNEGIYWGRVLEELIADEFAKREEVKIRRQRETLRHPERRWLRGKIDRRVLGLGPRAVLECKNASQYQSDKWGPTGSDKFPDFYEVQVRTYQSLGLGFDLGFLAVLLGGREHRRYRLERHQETEELILDALDQFRAAMLTDVHPAPMNSNDVELLYPDSITDALEATEDLLEDVSQLQQVKGQMKALQDSQKEITERLKMAIGPHQGLVDPDGNLLASWKTTSSKRLDQKAIKERFPRAAAKYTAESKYRRFLLK